MTTADVIILAIDLAAIMASVGFIIAQTIKMARAAVRERRTRQQLNDAAQARANALQSRLVADLSAGTVSVVAFEMPELNARRGSAVASEMHELNDLARRLNWGVTLTGAWASVGSLARTSTAMEIDTLRPRWSPQQWVDNFLHPRQSNLGRAQIIREFPGGPEEFFKQAMQHFRVIHEDETGRLLRYWPPHHHFDGREEPMHYVEVINSTPEPDGTHRRYYLRVNPWHLTARDAVASTFNLPGDEYKLRAQT